MTEYVQILLIVCPLVFLAGFIDAIAGGGGLISLPAYTIAGLDYDFASGNNKFSSTFGTLTATVRYCRSGKLLLKPALVAAALALPGYSPVTWGHWMPMAGSFQARPPSSPGR